MHTVSLSVGFLQQSDLNRPILQLRSWWQPVSPASTRSRDHGSPSWRAQGLQTPRRLQTALRASSVCDRTPSQVSTGSIIRSKDQDPGPGVAEVMPCRQWEANVPSPDHPSNCSPALSTPLMDLGPGGTVPHMWLWLWGQRQAFGGWGKLSAFFFFFFSIATVYTTVSHTASGTWPKPIGAGSWGSQSPLLHPPPQA